MLRASRSGLNVSLEALAAKGFWGQRQHYLRPASGLGPQDTMFTLRVLG